MSAQDHWIPNLKALVDAEADAAGGKKRAGYRAIAAATGLNVEYIYQLYTGAKKTMGVDAARAIGRAFARGREPGWFDRPIASTAIPVPHTGSRHEPVNISAKLNPATDLLRYAGYPRYVGVAQVISVAKVAADGFFEDLPCEPGKGGFVPSIGAGHMYAIRVKGDALAPAAEDGSYLLVRPEAEMHPGGKIIIGYADGRLAVRKLLFQRPDAIVVMPVSGGTPHTVDFSEIKYTHRIVSVIDDTEWIQKPPKD